jgi:hypothetical protein
LAGERGGVGGGGLGGTCRGDRQDHPRGGEAHGGGKPVTFVIGLDNWPAKRHGCSVHRRAAAGLTPAAFSSSGMGGGAVSGRWQEGTTG